MELTTWEYVDWIHLAQDRGQCTAFVKKAMTLRVQQNYENFLCG
jgi:hypothetical protein